MVATVSDGQAIEIEILMHSQSVFVLWHIVCLMSVGGI